MSRVFSFFSLFFTHTASSEIYTLSLHDALPISGSATGGSARASRVPAAAAPSRLADTGASARHGQRSSPLRSGDERSEEHTSELQSPAQLACRLLLEKKTNKLTPPHAATTRTPT